MINITDNKINSDIAPWSVLYNDDAFIAKEGTLMGRHAAGSAYLRAIAQMGYKEASVITRNNNAKQNFLNLFKSYLGETKIDMEIFPWDKPFLSEKYGGIFIGDPQIGNFSILRSDFGHDKYSIIGITHTTMSRGIMDFIGDILIKPVQEWDALICTSKCVKDTVDDILSFHMESLKERVGAKNFVKPQLPIIPLGVHTEDYNFSQKEKTEIREKLGINKEDIALTFVGRLSFHAKAHHFPMYKALQSIAKNLEGKRNIHLIQIGWFANDYISNIMKSEAKNICPDVSCHFIDGLDQKNKNAILSSSDIFISLTDNFQETFGLTPIEAMAAGVPSVVTDWNGYKDTVRNGKDGFTVPTISLKEGGGTDLLYQYFSHIINYDQYIGYASHRVAVDIDMCIKRITELINDSSMRKKMSESGKRRANEKFSWNKVMNSYADLRNQLNTIRLDSNLKDKSVNYISGLEPMKIFKSYPTSTLNENHKFFNKVDDLLTEDDYLFSSNSINITQDINDLDTEYLGLKVDINSVNSIINVLKEKNLMLKEIYSKLDIPESLINKTIIIMLKFDIIGLDQKV